MTQQVAPITVRMNGTAAVADVVLTERYTMHYRATGLRNERTGLHGKVEIFLKVRGEADTLFAYSQFNIERDEDRTRLANSAHRFLKPPLSETYPRDHLKHDLDIFCRDAWPVLLEAQEPTEVEGDPLVPIEFACRPWVLEGGGTILFGAPGRGKSYAALLVGISIDAGVDFLWPTRQHKVLFINLERDKRGVMRRIGCVNTALGLDPARSLLVQNARGRSLVEVKDATERAIAKHGVEVVILDSISRAGMGDLTENRPANLVADTLNYLCPTWLAIAHSPRADSDHMYGSVMLDAAADIIVRMASEEKDNLLGVRMDITKANDIPRVKTPVMAYEFDSMGLHRVRESVNGEFPKLVEGSHLSNRERIAAYLSAEGASAIRDIAVDNGIPEGTVRRELNDGQEFLRMAGQTRAGIWGLRYEAGQE